MLVCGRCKTGKVPSGPHLSALRIDVSQPIASSPMPPTSHPVPSDDLLTEEQVAERLQISPLTLKSWRSTKRVGSPTYCRIGGAVRYRRADIQSFIDASARECK